MLIYVCAYIYIYIYFSYMYIYTYILVQETFKNMLSFKLKKSCIEFWCKSMQIPKQINEHHTKSLISYETIWLYITFNAFRQTLMKIQLFSIQIDELTYKINDLLKKMKLCIWFYEFLQNLMNINANSIIFVT